MENGKIIIIEDNEMLRQGMRRNLEASGHTVVGEAGSVVAARVMIDGLGQDEVDIAVVDGNLSEWSRDGGDGEYVTAYIREKLGGVTVIGASLDGAVRGADMNVSKQDPWELYNTIRELPQ